MSEPAYTKVTGAFYAPQKIEGRPVALNGKITFTPTAPILIPGSGVHSSQARTGWVREGKLYESANALLEGVSLLAPVQGATPESFGYLVHFDLVDEAGVPAPLPQATITVSETETVSLTDLIVTAYAAIEHPAVTPAPVLKHHHLAAADNGDGTVRLEFQED